MYTYRPVDPALLTMCIHGPVRVLPAVNGIFVLIEPQFTPLIEYCTVQLGDPCVPALYTFMLRLWNAAVFTAMPVLIFVLVEPLDVHAYQFGDTVPLYS